MVKYEHGALAKWKRGCLQNSYAPVRFRHAPQLHFYDGYWIIGKRKSVRSSLVERFPDKKEVHGPIPCARTVFMVL